jgi:hypothetical protein
MGGGIGKAIIEHIKSEISGVEITAVGTNSIATSAMLKAGADHGTTGENTIVFNSAKADFIIGVTGIVFANAMHGEISSKMAEAVSSSPAHKVSLPVDKCNVIVLGIIEKSIQAYISEIVKKLKKKLVY